MLDFAVQKWRLGLATLKPPKPPLTEVFLAFLLLSCCVVRPPYAQKLINKYIMNPNAAVFVPRFGGSPAAAPAKPAAAPAPAPAPAASNDDAWDKDEPEVQPEKKQSIYFEAPDTQVPEIQQPGLTVFKIDEDDFEDDEGGTHLVILQWA